jgi:hypothetical protein
VVSIEMVPAGTFVSAKRTTRASKTLTKTRVQRRLDIPTSSYECG